MVSKVRRCADLSHDRTQTSNNQSGLCAVCEKIDFVSLTSATCEADNDGRHFHIGTMQNVMRKNFCPGCRLILLAARTMDHSHDMFDKITITIQRHYLSCTTFEHMEGSIQVIFDTSDGQYKPTVAGIIIRAEEAKPADSTGVKSTIFQSEHPVFRGRNVLSEVNIDLIKQWMQSCNFQHDSCRVPALEISREQNFRLIDVQEHKIISATMAEKYVALSYVWGPATKSSLTRDTLSQCSSPGGLKDLTIPRTISDAMQLVKYTGKRYLWVDSLCIV